MENKDMIALELIWGRMAQAIRESGEMSMTAFDLWFGHLHLIEISEPLAVFMVEDESKCQIIKERFSNLLAKYFNAEVGFLPVVEIVLDAEFIPPPLEGEGVVISPLQIAQRRINEREAAAELATLKLVETDEESDGEVSFYETNNDGLLKYNSDYTFDNFIVGSSNQIAHAVSLNVAENPGTQYNPLFIYGPSGLGKTHLMYAITNRLIEKNPKMKIIYVKGEEFTNQLIESLKKKNPAAFREKYRKADLLLIDDIQFIAGKDATQEEFFHTFNALYEAHRQIILTSDRPPKDMPTLEDRLRSRFESGLIADIQPPDYELRRAILRKKAQDANLNIPDTALEFLADRLHSNIRQIEGVIKKLGALSFLAGVEITTDVVKTAVPEFLTESMTTEEQVQKILSCTSMKYNVPIEDIIGTKRDFKIKQARNVAMYIMRLMTGLSLSQIGKYFERNHSTVYSNCETVEKMIEGDPFLDAEIHLIMKDVRT